MPAALDTYRDWESTGSRTRVHVVQIDRGDNSAANRLTLTDKAYYDKGVSGSKYHDTYPAPVQALHRDHDLVTSEDFNGTSINDIVLYNGDGRFDSLLSGESIIGHRFTVLRGDQSWSLMETEFPYRFIEVFRGQINSVSIGRDKIVLACSPIKYRLDNVIASIDEPIHYGSPIRNAPALLVDDVTQKYRFTTKPVYHAGGTFRPRDRGVTLALNADYTRVSESQPTDYFLGQIDLVADPDGQVTADFTATFHDISDAVQLAIAQNLVTDYPAKDASFEFTTDVGECCCFGNSDASFYYIDDALDRIRQRDLSTPGDVSTMGAYSAYLLISGATGRFRNIQAVAADLFCYTDGTTLKEVDLSTDWEIDTGTHGNTFDTSTVLGGTERCYGFAVIPSASLLYLLDRDGIVYKLSYTPGDISTATDAEVVLRLQPLGGAADYFYDMRFSKNGEYCYFNHVRPLNILQYSCVEAYDLDGAFRSPRGYFAHEIAKYTELFPGVFHMGSDGDKFYLMQSDHPTNGPTNIHEYSGISDYLLPVELFRVSMTSEHRSYAAGVHYNAEVRVGEVLTDLVGSMAAEYTVDRLGVLFAVRLENPNAALDDWVETYSVYQSAFQGSLVDHVRHVSTEPAKEKITVRYDKNFAVQSASELASSVSVSNRSYWSRPYEITSTTNVLTGDIDPEDLIVETFLADSSNAESVRDYVADLWSEDRQVYEWRTNLHWQTLLSNFGLGSIVTVGEDIRHPEFSVDDRVQVIGRRVNWSKEQQTLRVFK